MLAALDWLVGIYTWARPDFRHFVATPLDVRCPADEKPPGGCQFLRDHVRLARQEADVVAAHEKSRADWARLSRANEAARLAHDRVMSGAIE